VSITLVEVTKTCCIRVDQIAQVQLAEHYSDKYGFRVHVDRINSQGDRERQSQIVAHFDTSRKAKSCYDRITRAVNSYLAELQSDDAPTQPAQVAPEPAQA